MADNFKKIDKDFLLSDSSLNAYKYRLLTKGYLLSEFQKNPIGYYMHGTQEYSREKGVLVRWEDLRVDGDKVFGKPCINLSHPRGERTVKEIESGFLNAASFGNFVVLEVSDNPDDYLEGQTGPTVSKWYNRECSLVDMPGNYNALTELYDKDGNELKLSDLIFYDKQKTINTMSQIIITAEQLADLKLDGSKADANAVGVALKALVAEAARVPQLEADLAAEKKSLEETQKALKDLKAATAENQIKDLIDVATKEGKVTVAAAEQLKKDYANNPEGLRSLIATMPVYNSITGAIEKSNEVVKGLSEKSWNELDKEGLLPELKAKDFNLFKTKFKEAFKADYTGNQN